MKKRKGRAFFLVLILILFTSIAFLLVFGDGQLILPVQQREVFELEAGLSYQSSLSIKDQHIVNQQGETIILQGLIVPEVSRLDSQKRFHKDYFQEVFDCGGNVIRIPVHPEKWEQDPYYLWRYLDPIVQWAIENQQYVIIDLHFIGNIQNGEGQQMPDIKTNPMDFSVAFWKQIVEYFKDVPNVIYEIYNEPASIHAEAWGQSAQLLVDTIRAAGSQQLIIVSGIDYSYDLSYWMKHPIDDEHLLYSAHIFPNRLSGEATLQTEAEKIPIIVTEWGYISKEDQAKQSYLIGEKESYGIPLLSLMEQEKISWVACWYDESWEPAMFNSEDKSTTNWGSFILDYLAKNRK